MNGLKKRWTWAAVTDQALRRNVEIDEKHDSRPRDRVEDAQEQSWSWEKYATDTMVTHVVWK